MNKEPKDTPLTILRGLYLKLGFGISFLPESYAKKPWSAISPNNSIMRLRHPFFMEAL